MCRRMRVPLLVALLAGCGDPAGPPTGTSDGGAPPDLTSPTRSAIRHLVVIVQENHTFDNYLGRWCQAKPGSNPSCTDGPACCEAGPDREPSGYLPTVLDDKENGQYSPDHHQACELDEIDGGKMDAFVTSAKCGSPHNFAYVTPALAAPYHALAAEGAVADRYFQPVAGETSSNDMYFARARFVFLDNSFEPASIGAGCTTTPDQIVYDDRTIGDLLTDAGVSWAFYAEGYAAMLDAQKRKRCPDPAPGCAAELGIYPCTFDPSDVPFQYYRRFRDDPQHMRDYARFALDAAAGALPSVSFVKALGYRTEHPALKTTISAGVAFVGEVLATVRSSSAAPSTLVLFTYDEGGGYFDHVAPPPKSTVDGQPYGTRVPMIALGPFARRGQVSHVVLEHSSIVKLIEWNWLDGKTGQLGTRDAVVHNLGSLLDPARTGAPVPE